MDSQQIELTKKNSRCKPSLLLIGESNFDEICRFLTEHFTISRGLKRDIKDQFDYTVINAKDLSIWKDYELNLIKREDIIQYLIDISKLFRGKKSTIIVNLVEFGLLDQTGGEHQYDVTKKNACIDDYISSYKDVFLIDMRNIVTDESDFITRDGKCLVNQCYYEVARIIVELKLDGNRQLGFDKINPFEEIEKKIKNEIFCNIEKSITKTNSIEFVFSDDVCLETIKAFGIRFDPVRINRSLIKRILFYGNIVLIVGRQHDTTWMESNGLVEFKHFIREQYIGKTMVLIYGNCHTGPIIQYLKSSKWFSEKYEIYPWKPIQAIDDASYFKDNVLAWCDLFIHQSIQENNRYGKEFASASLIYRLNSDARVIAIPNVYHLPMFLFPRCESSVFTWPILSSTLFFRDRILDDVFHRTNGDIGAVVENHRNISGICSDELERKYEEFKIKIREREKQWDIKVADFIELSFRKKRLFYDPNHPTGYYFKWVGRHLLQQISLGGAVDKVNIDLDEMDQFEIPLSNEVRDYFFIEYGMCGDLRESTKNTLTHRAIDEDEYVRQYLSCEWQNKDCDTLFRIRSFKFFVERYGVLAVRYLLVCFIKRLIPMKIKKRIKELNK